MSIFPYFNELHTIINELKFNDRAESHFRTKISI